MSFAGTPLGQGRRLDHHTFLGKQAPSAANRPPSPNRLIPTSFAYAAPTLGSRSPPKPNSPRERTRTSTDHTDENEPALTRFARLKQQDNISLINRPGGTRTINTPPNPEKWSVKDTSVNIATAFTQAASDMPTPTPNNAWASGSSRPHAHVPRSTSVEYEAQQQSASSRRLAPPPSRVQPPGRNPLRARPPLSKSGSTQLVPESEPEEDPSQSQPNGRGKSPFDQLKDLSTRAVNTAAYFVRPHSREPEEPNTSNDASYNYSAEEREYAAAQSHARKPSTTHKRGRISTDNKAYKPSVSDEEYSDDEDFEEDGKIKRRKKKKAGPAGGPLTSLPVVGADKRKKKRAKGSKSNVAGGDDDGSESDDQQSASFSHRGSASRSVRGTAPPELANDSLEVGLDSIPEEEHDTGNDSRDSVAARSGSFIGYYLGKVVFYGSWIASSILFLFGRVLGTIIDLLFLRPTRALLGAKAGAGSALLAYAALGIAVLAAYQLREPLASAIPSLWGPSYPTSSLPPRDVSSLNDRLKKIEALLSTMRAEADRTKTRLDNDARSQLDVAGRVSSLESRSQKESSRIAEADTNVKDISRAIQVVRQDYEMLQAQLQAVKSQRGSSSPSKSETVGSDEEARVRLKALEERVGTVEGGVKEALEVGKNSIKAAAGVASWWNKVAAGKKQITLKADGHDVSALISRMVETAVSVHNKDTLARPDFALHSGGARIIPSLTSDTYHLTRNHIGRPPITALHHELHLGHCWSFHGTEGYLGVALSLPAFISHVSIDHVAKEVAVDMRTAPRQMEVWALVEGKDNLVKLRDYEATLASKKADALGRGETVEVDSYPKKLPKSAKYIRIASFTYNIRSPDNIQTYPILPEVAELGMDFGIVVLRVLNNWGRDELTCLYRFRVHGQQLGEIPLPYPEAETS